MERILAKTPTFVQFTGVLTLVAACVVADRFVKTRHINGAERLAEALLDTETLNGAVGKVPEASAQALAACAKYFVHVAVGAAERLGGASKVEDPIGYSRTHTHPYTHAVATVLTESDTPEKLLTYAVLIPEIGEVRGTRRVGASRFSGMSWARPAPDIAQITLGNDYTAQMESEFEVADYLVAGKTKLFGAATLRDNYGNVGRLQVAYDGSVTGTITRDAKVIGRFGGHFDKGIEFTQNHIQGG